jgi:OOP family OmpA-OmpF porin
VKILRKPLALCALGVLLGAVSLPAAAQGSGWYAGISAGPTSADVCDDLSGLGLASCDDSDTGFKVFGGKALSPNFALELGFVDLGKVTATGPLGSAKVTVDGLQFAGLVVGPINPSFSVFGKIGLFLWDVSATGPGGSLSDDGSDFMFGVGAAWNLTPQFALRAEWEQFDIDGDDVTMISAGVQFRF